MSRRGHIKDRTKLAAVLCIVLDIPYEHQLMMHEEHVLSLVQWDHFPKRHAEEGGDLFSNLQPLLIPAHREKTAKIDIPEIAKGKRIRRDEAAHQAAKAAKGAPESDVEFVLQDQPDGSKLFRRFDPVLDPELVGMKLNPQRKPRSRIGNRPFSKAHRPLRSRNNLKRRQQP